MAKDDDYQQRLQMLSKRALILAWPLINPLMQRIVDAGHAKVERNLKVGRDKCAMIVITPKGQAALCK
jgi:hypothetical protein